MKYENLLKMLDLRLDLFIDGSVFRIPNVGIIHDKNSTYGGLLTFQSLSRFWKFLIYWKNGLKSLIQYQFTFALFFVEISVLLMLATYVSCSRYIH